MEMTYWKL